MQSFFSIMRFSYLVAFVLLGSALINVPVVGKFQYNTTFYQSIRPVLWFRFVVLQWKHVEAYWGNMGVVNVAEYQTFGVACGAGQALNINFAWYFSANNWNCGADVTNQMRTLCPGSKCSFISVTNSVLGIDACPNQFKTLHVSYYCI